MSCFGAGSSYPCVTKEYLADVEKCRKKLRGIISGLLHAPKTFDLILNAFFG
jgi:hypothetical protein